MSKAVMEWRMSLTVGRRRKVISVGYRFYNAESGKWKVKVGKLKNKVSRGGKMKYTGVKSK